MSWCHARERLRFTYDLPIGCQDSALVPGRKGDVVQSLNKTYWSDDHFRCQEQKQERYSDCIRARLLYEKAEISEKAQKLDPATCGRQRFTNVSNIERSIALDDKSALAPTENSFAVVYVNHGGLRLRSKLQIDNLASPSS